MEKKSKNSSWEIYEDMDERFVNPYNFIPLLKECKRSRPEGRKDTCYTGYFECSIKLLSQLFIPNTSSGERLLTMKDTNNPKCEKEKWKGYDFFSYDDWSDKALCKKRQDILPPPPQEPVIPGSEIRGAVRSVYEAAFNGCMSAISLDRTLSRRSSEAKNEVGILKKTNGKWIIQPCKKAMLFTKHKMAQNPSQDMGKLVPEDDYLRWKEGQEIWIKLNETKFMKKGISIGTVIMDYIIIDGNDKSLSEEGKKEKRQEFESKGYEQGWLHKGEDFNRKHHESVFYIPKNKKLKKDIIELKYNSDVDNLNKLLDEYQDSGKNRLLDKNGSWYSGYKVSDKGTLVYYRKTTDNHFYLSPACIGKEVFTKTIKDLLENNGGYEPCTGKELCPACEIFGMLEKTEKNRTYAYGSKVRITDAKLIHPVRYSGDLFEKPMILPELGEPRPGAAEFYTRPPYKEKPTQGYGYWTYDYYHKRNGDKISNDRQSLGKDRPEIRGRKYYWHKEVKLKDYMGTDKNSLSAMRQRIRPMKPCESNPLFCFRVYFEQLNISQLSGLKWALDFGNPDCAHKIGRAKPLGFGSIQIAVDACHLRKVDAETGEWTLDSPKLEEFFIDPAEKNEAFEAVQIMANWKEKPENVNYPMGEDQTGPRKDKKNSTVSHQWFSLNKGKIQSPNFFKVLPEAKEDAKCNLEQEKALYKLKKISK